MHYYAEIDENNICVSTRPFSEELTDVPSNYVYLGTEEMDVLGKYYNSETNTWEEVVWKYYVHLNDANIVLETTRTVETITEECYVEITEEQYNSILAGMVFYKGSFMQMNEAIYRMLLGITTFSVN